MASFALSLLEHSPLLCASNRNLDDNASSRNHFPGLNRNLLRKLSGGRDDNGPNVVGPGALVASNLLAELGVVLDDSLYDGNEETEGFAGTGLCLRNTVKCQSVVLSKRRGSRLTCPLRSEPH